MNRRINKVLSFVMIFLLIGVANVSAATTVVTSKNKVKRTTVAGVDLFKIDGTAGILNASGNSVNDDDTDDTDTLQLYCADRKNDSVNVDVLTKDEMMDYSFSYVLQRSYPSVDLLGDATMQSTCYTDMNDNTGTAGSPKVPVSVWITQNSIWILQEADYKNTVANLDLEYYPQGVSSDTFCKNITLNGNDLDSGILLNTYVNALVEAAKAAADPATTTVTFDFEKGWTADGDVYKTNLISFDLSVADAEYKSDVITLSLADAPEGTKIYKENGEELTDSMTINKSEKVYITVPSDKAKKAPKFSLKADTTIKYLAAYKYVDKENTAPHQPIVLLNLTDKDVAGVLELSIAPDTASSISAAMYFIGLIILLSGAGIIYANVRPRKEEI